ncbi:Ctl2, partial [Symbiodinium sp. KB8]
ISQCNLPGKKIVIDPQQDLTDVEYDISGGRMKVEFHRKLDTGDCTDLVLTADTPLYIIMAMGVKGNLNVVGHGYSETHNVVCMGSMMNTIECKPPSEWDNSPPSLPATTSMAPGLSGLAGRGDKRCKRGDGAGQHLQPWHTTAHLRGVNTEALPPAKWERKLNEVESKAPEHFVRAKGQLRDLADADRLLVKLHLTPCIDYPPMASPRGNTSGGEAQESDASPVPSPRSLGIADGAPTELSSTQVLLLGDELSDASSDETKAKFAFNRYDENDIGASPNTVPRRCTDVFWLIIYIVYSCVVARVGMYVFPLRRPAALLKLSDWRNDHCGLGESKDKPLLFFCLRDTDPNRDLLNMYYPICVSECPTREFQGLYECPRNVKNRPFTTITTTSTMITSTVLTTQAPPVYAPPNPYQPYWKPIQDAERGGIYNRPGWYPPSPYSNPYSNPYDPYDSYWPDGAYRPAFQDYPAPVTHSEEGEAQRARTARRLMEAPDHRLEPHIGTNNIVLSDWRGNFTLIEVSGYPSHPFVNMVCLPWVANLKMQTEEFIQKTPLVRYFATLINAYQPLIVAAITGIVLSYVYITLLRFRASILVRGGLATLILGPLSFGAYFIWCWRKEHCPMSTGDKLGDGASGFGFLIIGLTFLAVSCNLEHNVEMAISCIEWSCKAVLETPSLKLEPVLALACRGVVDGASILLIAWIWTSELDDKDTFKMQYQTLLPPQSELQLGMCAIVAFWCLWTNWIITALSDFVIMYTTEQWFFNGGMEGTGHAPCCSILRAYFVCLRYHFGTMVLGGATVGSIQPLRLALGFVHAAVEMESNSVLAVLSCCCNCVSDLYTLYLEPLSRNAYMDLALNARDFWDSAAHALEVNSFQADTIHILNGATWLFQVAGAGGSFPGAFTKATGAEMP